MKSGVRAFQKRLWREDEQPAPLLSSFPLAWRRQAGGAEPPFLTVRADRAARLKKPEAGLPTLGPRSGHLEAGKIKFSPAQAIAVWGFPLPDAKVNPKHLSCIVCFCSRFYPSDCCCTWQWHSPEAASQQEKHDGPSAAEELRMKLRTRLTSVIQQALYKYEYLLKLIHSLMSWMVAGGCHGLNPTS